MTIAKSTFLEFTVSLSDIAFCEILRNDGSSPREVGAWMLIKRSGKILGTIGGGQLEYNVIKQVTEQDWSQNFKFQTETRLGPELGQCCGGKILLGVNKLNENLRANLLSRLDDQESSFPEILIFGAGNIGASLASQLNHLPLRVKIIDNRKKQISTLKGDYEKKFSLLPEQEVRDAKPNSAFIIVTHDHGLDFILCYEILLRNDASYIGMIGSKSKRGVLVNWLREKGIQNVAQLNIPIGKTFFESKDKRPEIISAHVVSEMLFHLENRNELLRDS